MLNHHQVKEVKLAVLSLQTQASYDYFVMLPLLNRQIVQTMIFFEILYKINLLLQCDNHTNNLFKKVSY